MHASRPFRISTCTSDDTTPTSSEFNTAAGRGVDEVEPETRPAWLRSDSSGCSRVSGGDKIALTRVVPPPPPRKLPLGNRTTDLDQHQRSRTSKPADAGLGYGGAGMGEYAEGLGPERAERLDAESTIDRGKITADARMEAGRIQGDTAPLLWTGEEIDWFIDAEESLETPFEPDDPLGFTEESIEPPFEPFEPDDEAWRVK
ncbi:hypothetical protein B0H14DRAFT_3739150 [Mycena olivaceomarginata]|nr:hypothetical protein B0H14DRAFT_3739150 [Mycena olivaceomarginata]